MHREGAVWPLASGNPGRERKRSRHDEAVVVIGKLANQIDPARSTKDGWRFAPPGAECAGKLRILVHVPVSDS